MPQLQPRAATPTTTAAATTTATTTTTTITLKISAATKKAQGVSDGRGVSQSVCATHPETTTTTARP